MMDRIPPVPTPRVSHLEQKRAECKMLRSTSKKPVPLPRLKVFKESGGKSTEVNSDNLVLSERQTCDITNHVSENSNRMPYNERIRSQNLKEDWKIECDDAQLKGKSVIGRTKTVGASIEKSVRNMITRRLTVRTTTHHKLNDFSANKNGRSQSLPSEDIFQSISFISPLEDAQQELEVCEDTIEGDCVSTSGAPPPVYPPPPLPDESVYDEVHSVVSSHSSSYEPCCDSNITDFETLYEDIAQIRENGGHELSGASQKKTEGNVLENSESSVDSQHKFIIRSDSWSFYDSTLEKDIYQNVAPSDISSFSGSDSVYNRHCSSKLSCTESTPSSLQEDLNCDNCDEISEGESCTNSNMQFGHQQSVNIWNEMYENWETNIPRRRVEGKPKVLTKSVILEFDPLYETGDSSGEAKSGYTEVFLPADTGETDSPYGRINRVVISEVPEQKTGENEEFVCPPVPPRRYDSISVVPAEENCIGDEPENESSSEVAALPDSDVNRQGLSQEKGESEFTSGINNSNGNVDSVVGRNRKAALVRWASMKRAIQMMADGSSFRRAVKEQLATEDKLGYQNSLFYGGQNEACALVTRPNWTPNAAVQRSGILYRTASGSKDYTPRRCILAEGKLSCFTDKSGTSISEVIPLNKLLSIQFVPEYKTG